MFLIRIVLIPLLLGTLLSACSEEQSPPLPPQVAVERPMRREVALYGELVGQTFGAVDIAIRARVDGQLEGVHFQEGKPVKKGQLLYSIDPKPFEAKVVAVQGEVSEARTALTKASADLARIEPLAKMNAVSRRELDAAVAAQKAAKAMVETAQAKLEYITIERGYTQILAPVDGVVGISKAKVGDYVGKDPNPVVLNTVSQTDPIHVRVALSESEYLQFARRHLKERSNSPEQSKTKRPLQLVLADGKLYEHEGEVVAVDSQIDPKTGTLMLEASFPNPTGLLRPGQYAKVRFVREVKEGALLVWQRAVQELQDMYQVYVVQEDGKVSVRRVQVGDKVEGLWIIESGLLPEELVIVEGIQKVRSGMIVQARTPAELGVVPPEGMLTKQVTPETQESTT